MDDIRHQFPSGTKISVNGDTWIVVGHYGGLQVPSHDPTFTTKRAGVVAIPESGESTPQILRRDEFTVIGR